MGPTIPTWPAIAYADWKDTCTALHLRTQVVGKVRLAQTPWWNHSWHATLYLTTSGLTTALIPHGSRAFSIDFDLITDELIVQCSDGAQRRLPLLSESTAEFTSRLLGTLDQMGLPVRIHGCPNEMPGALPFLEDREQRPWDRDAVERFWRALLAIDRVFTRFRTGFVGKASSVHLFWGALDLAVTRFSGRRAPLHPGGAPCLPDEVTREAYSHEVSSAGFWPGGAGADDAAFYSYAWPEPEGFREAKVEPAQARYDERLGEFLLPYEAVRSSRDPEGILLAFLQSTYEAAATLGRWDREALECPYGKPRVPRPL